ncbi:hypothetical protein LTR37_004392 [Vermiconidia calcicola]|uniref:Uncharacterized protein n=1 Tax=Vermiconidia calcicola TaxID=1690605 RepID=A0ACC3NMA6_9PEZI|nr:hypothetical protein LTR37_004392 [Vermiconidia calcicola]
MAEPAYAFSIPSIADDLPLACRIYHPKGLQNASSGNKIGQRSFRGAILAHPYALLGGSFDDTTVLSITETLLDQGFIVGTFNFRGAGDSAGRTTWSGKAEQEDYTSFAGLIAYYIHGLGSASGVPTLDSIHSASDLENNFGSQNAMCTRGEGSIHLLLGGYSYGSLVLARLPPMSAIIQRMESAEIGTAAAEIVLRARTLSNQTKNTLRTSNSPTGPRGRQLTPIDATTSPTKRNGASPIVMGGEETDPSARRRSRDSRRSMDLVRKSVDVPHRIRARMGRSSGPQLVTGHDVQEPSSAVSQSSPSITIRYLFISPVLLPFTHTLSPPGPPSFTPGMRKLAAADKGGGIAFLQNQTLVLFGSADGFTSAGRLRVWAEKMARDSKSSFEWAEVKDAGHFWREAGVMQQLQEKLAAWVIPS